MFFSLLVERRFDCVEYIFILLCLQRLKTKHSVEVCAIFCEFILKLRKKEEKKNQNKRKKFLGWMKSGKFRWDNARDKFIYRDRQMKREEEEEI